MKDIYPQISLVRLCRLLGVSPQAFYQHLWFVADKKTKEQLVLSQVTHIRQEHPVIGCRKLYCMLQTFLMEHHIKMGRDALFNLLAVNKLLIRKRRRKFYTTQSSHWLKKYPNRIKNWEPQMPDQLWVADITYVPITRGFLYLSLITDAYSHKIMGYHIAESLEAVHTAKALQMALKNRVFKTNPLIHHSDRGIQYCSADYVKLLEEENIQISMTENGDPLENPVAERINGIIKQEYLKHYYIANQPEALQVLEKIVDKYNQKRPHQSIKMQTPDIVHSKNLLINRKWSKQKQLPNIVNPYQD